MTNDYQFIDGSRLSSVIEALIFSSPEPITADKLCEIIQQGEENLELETGAIDSFVEKLNQRYDENGLAFGIRRVAGGFTFATRKKYDPWLSIIQHENAYRKLSQSAIETLAIVAYKQPITKPEVDDIRGVDSGYILRQLLEKVLIEVSGRLDAPGKPLLYRTTQHFLKHFGLKNIDELPKPREIEEILKDDDMAEHRQFLIDRQLELEDLEQQDGEGSDDISLLNIVKKISDNNGSNGNGKENGSEQENGHDPQKNDVEDESGEENEQENSGDQGKVEDVVSS
ncbi:SMC-Scp complex subunit ScpB [Aliifodinibius sp. S!AR15-10]|uniref:SMC-Scp complex subunit ScpB n=1 Tax=Aliifodinibius sp. S!AR15-10 TaxID=2950437 RepID=UPI002866F4C7|nr:SMC-Scp complex subunit ScpB [Aliifodinibius sp. S!AR15-10]MDR8392832.1 SMC-Scp complex subunit ScpB [Aliifodinibius sp. S!AR15-10]